MEEYNIKGGKVPQFIPPRQVQQTYPQAPQPPQPVKPQVRSKVVFTLEFDRVDRYDSAIMDVLQKIPDYARQKEFIVSALLFYIRSPLYATQTRLDEFSKDTQDTLQKFSDLMDSKLADTQAPDLSKLLPEILRSIKRTMTTEMTELLKKELKKVQMAPVGTISQDLLEEKIADGAEHIMKKLGEEFFG